jgi:hypothetical protein
VDHSTGQTRTTHESKAFHFADLVENSNYRSDHSNGRPTRQASGALAARPEVAGR